MLEQIFIDQSIAVNCVEYLCR